VCKKCRKGRSRRGQGVERAIVEGQEGGEEAAVEGSRRCRRACSREPRRCRRGQEGVERAILVVGQEGVEGAKVGPL